MSATRALIILGFAAVLVGAGALEWWARRPGSRLPTFGQVCGFVLAYRLGRLPVGRLAALGIWWWIGWHFFAR